MIKRTETTSQVYANMEPSKSPSAERRLSLAISDALYRELTMRKLDEGRSYNAILIDALRAYLRTKTD